MVSTLGLSGHDLIRNVLQEHAGEVGAGRSSPCRSCGADIEVCSHLRESCLRFSAYSMCGLQPGPCGGVALTPPPVSTDPIKDIAAIHDQIDVALNTMIVRLQAIKDGEDED